MKIIFKIIRKLILFYYWVQVKFVFSEVECNLAKVRFGADVPGPFIIHCPEKLRIGDGSSISGKLYIHAFGGVIIGRCCHIAQGLVIYSHNHNWRSEKCIPYDEVELLKPVTIGDAVWIGANATIAPGALIGNGVIVSSGSVVFGVVPDCAIIRGNPAEVVGYRNKEVFQKLYCEGKMM